jgi:hypothetical protein
MGIEVIRSKIKTVMKDQQILTKLEKLEKELLKIKKGAFFKFPKKIISLKGILKGLKINDKDIQKAKKSLFREIKL